ncbi:DNA polymerase kappa-like [Saccostrea echinata]|uniref:DNA polymerase kappa-like n=1 Tax=Saccostrea echinata TaxID=191078 RepID=UPI002A83A718|nr:DNA polymerase kappa-like [Saccostrea echinata]
MDNAHEATEDEEEEEDWMAINWDSNLTSGTKELRNKSCFDNNDKVMPSKDLSNSKETGKVETKSSETLMSRMLLNDNKAGMTGLDKEKINQIIFEASKGSKYFENEKKKEEQMAKRIEEQKQKMKDITQEQLETAEREADLLLEEFDRLRDLSKTIVHIDMDAFYAAVEMRDDPSLRDKPMAVGGNSMLSTSNYHARKFGVRAAMPGFIGKKLCPELVIVPAHFDKYTSVSKQVKEILATFDPNFCTVSLDEAYLDFTDHLTKRSALTEKERTVICRTCDSFDKNLCLCDLNETLGVGLCEDGTLKVKAKVPDACTGCGKPVPEFEMVTFGTAVEDAVKEMRSRIQQKTCLTASAGVAPNMMLAKVCSDMNKPNGQYIIPPTVEAVMSFIRELSIRKISGIGKVSERMLNALGVKTCQDLYNKRGLLYHLYSQISFNYFMRICLGIGSTTVERDGERKSMSTERTFSELSAPSELYSKCLELSHSLAEDLQSEELKGRTVAIKIKTVKFDVKTRACSLPDYTNDAEVIYAAAKDLLCKEIKNVHPQPLQLRLMGVRMSSLVDQNFVTNKKQQNTLMQFVKKGEKTGKNENQQLVEKCSNHVDIHVHVAEKDLQCSEKSEQQNDDPNSGNCAEQINQCHKENCEQRRRNENSHSNSDSELIQDCALQNCTSETLFLLENPEKSKEIIANVTKLSVCDVNKEAKSYERCEYNEPCEDKTISDDCTTKEDIAEKKPETLWYTCPVCRDEVGCSDLHVFNRHIDTCLSRSIVMECSRYQPEEETARDKKPSTRKTLTPKHKSISSKQLKSSSRNSQEIMETKSQVSGSPVSRKSLIEKREPMNDEHQDLRHLQSPKIVVEKTVKLSNPSSEGPSTSKIQMKDNVDPDVLTETQDSKLRETLVCPVCFMEQTGVDLDTFNQHVDSCLCKGTISDILKEQKQNNKRSLEKQESPGPKGKRKRQESGPKCQNIASFFQINT